MSFFLDPCTVYLKDFRYCPHGLKKSAGTYLKKRPQYFITYGSEFTVHSEIDVRKSVQHHTIQINQPTRCNSFTSLLLDLYVWLNMFRALLRPSSEPYNCISSLCFYR